MAELEESKNNLLLENQQFRENVSGLHSTIQNLENSSSSSASQDASAKDRASENEELKSQIEEAYMLVEKLMAENAELVEKVHMLCVELDRPDTEIKLSEVTGSDGLTEFVKPSEPESSEVTSISVPELDSSEKTLAVNDNSDSIHAEHARDLQLVPDDIEEIVQIPLDDNDVRDLQLQDTKNVENDDAVPITDAPLIGAPFRLISFFAKYVSGADLVSQNSSNTSN